MAKKIENVLTVNFLVDLYHNAIKNSQICSVVAQYMDDTYLPDQHFQALNQTLRNYYHEFKCAPGYGVITQKLSSSRAVSELLEEIQDTASDTDPEGVRDCFESYLRQVRFKKILKEVNKKYEDGAREESLKILTEQLNELNKFSLKPSALIDIAGTYEDRLRENKERIANPIGQVVNSWHIPQLDAVNKGCDMRGQLSCILANSGVGKSFFGRFIGHQSAYVSGLNVLHFSFEMSESEVVNAYSGMLNNMASWEFERGQINDHALQTLKAKMQTFQGTLKVRAYTKFAQEPSTRDVWNDIERYKETYGFYPSVVIIDSGDLLSDSTGRYNDAKTLRIKLNQVYRDLKDIAMNANCWVVSLFQSTIDSPEFLNDESKVLTPYHTSEAKGILRPCSHFITLSQSQREYQEEVLRIFIAKYRGAKRQPVFRIACDYSHGFFYDPVRSLNMVTENQ